MSIYDKFDLDPFGSGNDKPIIQIGRPFEYYTRFYPEGKTPDIDSMYNNFTPEKSLGGPLVQLAKKYSEGGGFNGAFYDRIEDTHSESSRRRL